MLRTSNSMGKQETRSAPLILGFIFGWQIRDIGTSRPEFKPSPLDQYPNFLPSHFSLVMKPTKHNQRACKFFRSGKTPAASNPSPFLKPQPKHIHRDIPPSTNFFFFSEKSSFAAGAIAPSIYIKPCLDKHTYAKSPPPPKTATITSTDSSRLINRVFMEIPMIETQKRNPQSQQQHVKSFPV